MDAVPDASQPFDAAHDVRKAQTFAEQTGDLARPDQIPETALAAPGLHDVVEHEQTHHRRVEPYPLR